jgi:hypothetical protein
VIGVTRGCIDTLSRDELQGVIAHEFSHIVNGDMRLNIRLMGILFGIIMITFVGRILLRTGYISGGGNRRSRSGDKKGGNPLPFIGIAMIIIGYIGVFFANLIKSAISRQREYLADAAAVQYTRNPGGIASALNRIAKLSMGSRVTNTHAAEAGHLFFGDCSRHFHLCLRPIRRSRNASAGLMHPACGSKPQRSPRTGGEKPGAPPTGGNRRRHRTRRHHQSGRRPRNHAHDARRSETQPRIPSGRAPRSMPCSGCRKKIPTSANAKASRALTPKHSPCSTRCLPSKRNMDHALRLPLAERLLPALRNMPASVYPPFRKALEELTEANEEIDLFEFAIRNMILRQLGSVFGTVDKAASPLPRNRAGPSPDRDSALGTGPLGHPEHDGCGPCYQAGMLQPAMAGRRAARGYPG